MKAEEAIAWLRETGKWFDDVTIFNDEDGAACREIADLIERLDGALAFYTEGKHMIGCENWDTVSGEPINWLHDIGRDDVIHAVEDGSIARKARGGDE